MTDHHLRPVIRHEPKTHIHTILMTENECPSFRLSKCTFAQFSKPNPNPVYYFLTRCLAGKSEKATLTVNIFLLGILHETRSDGVEVCGTENQCPSFQSLVSCLDQFLRPVNGPPGTNLTVCKKVIK